MEEHHPDAFLKKTQMHSLMLFNNLKDGKIRENALFMRYTPYIIKGSPPSVFGYVIPMTSHWALEKLNENDQIILSCDDSKLLFTLSLQHYHDDEVYTLLSKCLFREDALNIITEMLLCGDKIYDAYCKRIRLV